MARKKTGDSRVKVGNVTGISGEVNIAGGDIYKGYTAEQVSVLLTQITSTFQRKKFDGRCPYKGLDVFEEQDAELFFGRERLVEDLISRVKESRTVFITGPSGSGKSSLVRAGLIHALKQGAIKNLRSERWLYETMKPGREPIKDLALAFSRLKGPDLANYFRAHTNESTILNECAESALSGRKDQRFLLFVDQFEEVFTQVNQEAERLAFLNMLAHAGTVENGRVIVLFAMRSDFVSNCAGYPAINELLSRQFRQIGAMQPEELVSAIASPAKRVGLPIEEELIARIINDMKGEPGALPLMQFALKELFEARQAKGGDIALTLEDYLEREGIRKMLARHADETFNQLNTYQQELARSIFSGLIEIGKGRQDTRRTALFEELVPANTNSEDVGTVVQKLADARLIITDEQAGKDTVTISHERLINAWPWLEKLINENRDVIALQNEIASDAKEWEDHQRDLSYLYTGARLATAREKLDANKIVLSGLAQAFIETGVEVFTDELSLERQRTQRLQRQRIILAIALLSAIAMSVLAIFGFIQARASTKEAQKQSQIALARQLAAQAQSINATRSSKQMIAALLATQSLKMFPSGEVAQILLNNNFAALPISRMTHDSTVNSVAFSSDGKYVVSGSEDGTARVWETTTGKEVARMTYDESVWSVAFSPDGKYVVSGGCDKRDANFLCLQGSARVWKATSGKEVTRMIHEGLVLSVAFSPDGKHVVSGSRDGTARVWEAATGREIARMSHDWAVGVVAFSPDGKYVVSGSEDLTARVWEATTGKEVARMTHDFYVTSVAFSPNGKYVISGSEDQTARVWEATTGKEVAHLILDGAVYSLVFSPDGKYIVSGSADGSARVWEAATGKEVARMTHDDIVYSVAFSSDGKYVVSGSKDKTARVWEATTGKEIARMTHDDIVYSVAFSSDGKYVVSGSYDNTARIWKAVIPKEVARVTHDGGISSLAFSPDGKYVVSGSYDNTARVWEVATGQEVARMIHDAALHSVAFSPNGKYVVSGSQDKTVRVWEATTGKEIARMIHSGIVYAVTFSPDGKYVASGGLDRTVRVWEATTGKEAARMNHGGAVSSIAFSPDGKYLVSGSYDKTARVWEASTGKEVARMTHDDVIWSVAFSPDGKYVVSGGYDWTARVWEMATGKEVARMTHDAAVRSLVFSPDGKYVASGSEDKTTRVWEAATGKEVAHITHDDIVYSVAFSPDGKYIVSGSADGSARVWETATDKEVARMLHSDDVWSVAFSPDGKYVVSGGLDRSARIWVWQPNDLIANACASLPRNLTPAEWQQYVGDALPYPTKQEDAICPNLPLEPESIPTASPTP